MARKPAKKATKRKPAAKEKAPAAKAVVKKRLAPKPAPAPVAKPAAKKKAKTKAKPAKKRKPRAVKVPAPAVQEEIRPPGRPTLYTAEIATQIIMRMASGESLRKICREEAYPAEATVRLWAADNVEGFSARYARARALQMDSYCDECVEIADNASDDFKIETDNEGKPKPIKTDSLARAGLRIQTRQWEMARIARDTYGNALKLSGSVGLHEGWLEKMSEATA